MQYLIINMHAKLFSNIVLSVQKFYQFYFLNKIFGGNVNSKKKQNWISVAPKQVKPLGIRMETWGNVGTAELRIAIVTCHPLLTCGIVQERTFYKS